MLRCLWIARDVPYPQDAGDKVYSAQLARAISDCGAYVRFLGFPGSSAPVPIDSRVNWVEVPGKKRPLYSAIFSFKPNQAAVHDTQAYRDIVLEQLRENWDAIILDSYGSGWALRHIDVAASAMSCPTPIRVYISHNHETRLWRDMASSASGNIGRRIALWLNYFKTRVFERALIRSVDLITLISSEDLEEFSRYGPSADPILLTPGYSGAKTVRRTLDTSVPRRIMMLGSFRWLIKQENLQRFVTAADEQFHANNIILDVLGDVPSELLMLLRRKVKATRFHGFVADITSHASEARLAVVPEIIGGGFKLKFLDYIFRRVPVATLSDAAAGLPLALREQMISSGDISTLVNDIINAIDDTDRLNGMQERAFVAASELFQWHDRGSAFLDSMSTACNSRPMFT